MLSRDMYIGDPETKFWVVPVQETIEIPESVHLPLEVVKILIKKSSFQAKMPLCVCREGFDCQTYPQELGCIALGNAVKNGVSDACQCSTNPRRASIP